MLCSEGSPPVWSALRYRGDIARCVLAFKNHQRTDLAAALAPALARALSAAIRGRRGPALAVALPARRASLRRRGYAPVPLLLGRLGLPRVPLLAWARQPREQIGLGLAAREANLRGALRLRGRPGGFPGGFPGDTRGPVTLILVDDVLTTGATMREALRVLGRGNLRVAGIVTLARAGDPRAPLNRPRAPSQKFLMTSTGRGTTVGSKA